MLLGKKPLQLSNLQRHKDFQLAPIAAFWDLQTQLQWVSKVPSGIRRWEEEFNFQPLWTLFFCRSVDCEMNKLLDQTPSTTVSHIGPRDTVVKFKNNANGTDNDHLQEVTIGKSQTFFSILWSNRLLFLPQKMIFNYATHFVVIKVTQVMNNNVFTKVAIMKHFFPSGDV